MNNVKASFRASAASGRWRLYGGDLAAYATYFLPKRKFSLRLNKVICGKEVLAAAQVWTVNRRTAGWMTVT